MPTLTYINNGEQFCPEITEEPGGFKAVRHGWIDTGDVTAALLSTIGMPSRGDPWEASTPNLILQRKTVRIWSGEVCLARFEYATPGLGDGVLDYPAKIGKPVSIAVPSTTNVTAKTFLIKIDPPPLGSPPGTPPGPGESPVVTTDPLIAQGQGVPREAGLMDQRVKVAYSLANLIAIPWARIRRLHSTQAINSDDVVLPNYFGTGYAYAAAKKTLRYRSVEFETQADVFVVNHIMAEAVSHHVEYEDLDEDGNVQLPNKYGHIYPYDTFGGLW